MFGKTVLSKAEYARIEMFSDFWYSPSGPSYPDRRCTSIFLDSSVYCIHMLLPNV